jgi:sRNA-binding carbon storage regulator CsrA
MLVVSRLPGQSLVFGNKMSLTLSHFENNVARLTSAKLTALDDACTCVLREGETMKLLPDIQVVFLQPLADRSGIRLGLIVPLHLQVYRKELLDALRGSG